MYFHYLPIGHTTPSVLPCITETTWRGCKATQFCCWPGISTRLQGLFSLLARSIRSSSSYCFSHQDPERKVFLTASATLSHKDLSICFTFIIGILFPYGWHSSTGIWGRPAWSIAHWGWRIRDWWYFGRRSVVRLGSSRVSHLSSRFWDEAEESCLEEEGSLD